MVNPLRWIELDRGAPRSGFPWDLAAVRALDRLEFSIPVTFLVGENGSGKSTLMEAIAMAAGFNAEGGTPNLRFAERPTESKLHEQLRLAWNRRPRRAFFLRAETFFNMATAYEELPRDGLPEPDPLMELHDRSHGQQFLDVVRHRFGPGGLFLMDEPESAQSFTSELALLRVMYESAAQGSQFIVATHSPVLLCLPEANILQLDETGIEPVSRDEAVPYRDMKSFLDDPELYLRHLLADEN